jgi:hypothetical protein
MLGLNPDHFFPRIQAHPKWGGDMYIQPFFFLLLLSADE